MFCGDLNGKEIHKRGVMCICIADSLWFTTGISTKLETNYAPISFFKKKKKNPKVIKNTQKFKAVVFLAVMYGCEIWTMKKAEHQRIDALELWCWRRLLRVPWTARRLNLSSI